MAELPNTDRKGASPDASFLSLGKVLKEVAHGKTRTGQAHPAGNGSRRTSDSTRHDAGSANDRPGGGQDLRPLGAVFAVDLRTDGGAGKTQDSDPRKAGARAEALSDQPAGASRGRTGKSRQYHAELALLGHRVGGESMHQNAADTVLRPFLLRFTL